MFCIDIPWVFLLMQTLGNEQKKLSAIVEYFLQTMTHVNKHHLQKYLDEYFYRLNRSIYKETIFDNLIKRMINHEWVGWKLIVALK